MAHIVFAAPGLDRFHLHDRLRRDLERRGHRVTVLCLEPAQALFWSSQGSATALVRGQAADDRLAPCAALAGGVARTHRRLARLAPALTGWLGTAAADLLLFHQQRGADHRLLHFLARAAGIRAVWTGDGLLPHTLQIDDRGLDGEASCVQRRAKAYRVVAPDAPFLDTCLVHALAAPEPFPLPRSPVVPPPLWTRLGAAIQQLAARDVRGARLALSGWRQARTAPPAEPAAPLAPLPRPPFLAVLLQHPGDPRCAADAPGAPGPDRLLAAVASAARRLDPDLSMVAVLPPGCRPGAAARSAPVAFVPAALAATAAAAASAVVTVNHPLACAALLAETPVVHLGRALYGLPGVAVPAALGDLDGALQRAFARRHAALRRRFLTWLFRHGHVWCSATHPDYNGLLGLVQAIEQRLGQQPAAPLRHRIGPPWPLSPSSGP